MFPRPFSSFSIVLWETLKRIPACFLDSFFRSLIFFSSTVLLFKVVWFWIVWFIFGLFEGGRLKMPPTWQAPAFCLFLESQACASAPKANERRDEWKNFAIMGGSVAPEQAKACHSNQIISLAYSLRLLPRKHATSPCCSDPKRWPQSDQNLKFREIGRNVSSLLWKCP